MSIYRTREGVCLVNVAGQHLLVADRIARKECPYIWEISDTSAFFWKRFTEGTDTKDIVDESSVRLKIDKKAAARSLMAFLVKCKKYHYFK